MADAGGVRAQAMATLNTTLNSVLLANTTAILAKLLSKLYKLHLIQLHFWINGMKILLHFFSYHYDIIFVHNNEQKFMTHFIPRRGTVTQFLTKF